MRVECATSRASKTRSAGRLRKRAGAALLVLPGDDFPRGGFRILCGSHDALVSAESLSSELGSGRERVARL